MEKVERISCGWADPICMYAWIGADCQRQRWMVFWCLPHLPPQVTGWRLRSCWGLMSLCAAAKAGDLDVVCDLLARPGPSIWPTSGQTNESIQRLTDIGKRDNTNKYHLGSLWGRGLAIKKTMGITPWPCYLVIYPHFTKLLGFLHFKKNHLLGPLMGPFGKFVDLGNWMYGPGRKE